MMSVSVLLFGFVSTIGDDQCPRCHAQLATIRTEVESLRTAKKWRDRDASARRLASVRWECHPEVVEALMQALRTDRKAKVRAEAAEALGEMVPNVPLSHVALVDASSSDPEASVRKQAGKALKAKGLRCVVDCPICGPLPTGSIITGPTILLPEWPAKPSSSTSLPPALPDPQ